VCHVVLTVRGLFDESTPAGKLGFVFPSVRVQGVIDTCCCYRVFGSQKQAEPAELNGLQVCAASRHRARVPGLLFGGQGSCCRRRSVPVLDSRG